MRHTLAIYITLSLVVLVATAQFLYFKLVIARNDNACEAAGDTLDLDWLYEPVEAWVGMEADEPQLAPVGDPVLVGV